MKKDNTVNLYSLNNEIKNNINLKELICNSSSKKRTVMNNNFELSPNITNNVKNHNNNLKTANITNNNSEKKEIYPQSKFNNYISNKPQIIEKKISELNEEIKKFKEERDKINKLKLEYEKLQSKLITDIQQFNEKKTEFEKYRQAEINKIKTNKKKSENKLLSDLKNQNQNLQIQAQKDKETIKNLRMQINDLQNLVKIKVKMNIKTKNLAKKQRQEKSSKQVINSISKSQVHYNKEFLEYGNNDNDFKNESENENEYIDITSFNTLSDIQSLRSIENNKFVKNERLRDHSSLGKKSSTC